MSLLSRLKVLPRIISYETPFCNSKISISIQRSSCFTKWTGQLYSKPTQLQISSRYLSSEKDGLKGTSEKLTQRAKLKQTIRDYGATIIVFHIVLSLASLGICYIAISSGIDAASLLSHVGVADSILSSKLAVGSSTFVMAYAVHKMFVPARMAITISVAPFLVKYLRSINVLKTPKPKV